MKSKSIRYTLMTTAGLVGALVFAGLIMSSVGSGNPFLSEASAAQEKSAEAAVNRLPTYFPNTEVLKPDEMRITALGTGLPTPITRAQKSTAWMVELGNGDVFLFDLGTGSMENLFGLRPDFSRLDKVFLSHLHSDHFGDLDAFIVGSWLS